MKPGRLPCVVSALRKHEELANEDIDRSSGRCGRLGVGRTGGDWSGRRGLSLRILPGLRSCPANLCSALSLLLSALSLLRTPVLRGLRPPRFALGGLVMVDLLLGGGVNP